MQMQIKKSTYTIFDTHQRREEDVCRHGAREEQGGGGR
jgi:hypothetical protein